MTKRLIAWAACLAAAQAGAQSSLSLLPDGHYEWTSFHDQVVAERASVDGFCFVHIQAPAFQSAVDIREIVFRARPGGEINIDATNHLSQNGKPGLGPGLDIAIPVGKDVRRITFGPKAAVLWTREQSRCLHPG